MVNAKFNKIEDYRDIETLAEYEKLKLEGGNLEQLKTRKQGRRDNGEHRFNGMLVKMQVSQAVCHG
jgi:oligo-1,6-glucosidase